MAGWLHQGRLCVARGAVVLGMLGAALPASAVPDVASIELRDQHGEVDSLGAHAGELVVVFVVTATSMLNTRFWEEDLRKAIDGVTYLRVADLPGGSRASVDAVAAKLLVVVPSGVSVMIDPERRWATALDLDTTEPNLLLFTRDGLLGGRFRGRWHPDNVPDVVARLRQLEALP